MSQSTRDELLDAARIDGVSVSTVCHPSMGRFRTVLCQPINDAGAGMVALAR